MPMSQVPSHCGVTYCLIGSLRVTSESPRRSENYPARLSTRGVPRGPGDTEENAEKIQECGLRSFLRVSASPRQTFPRPRNIDCQPVPSFRGEYARASEPESR
jgi:hypothetical protein